MTVVLDALTKTVTVPVAPDLAFAFFTRDIARWWPLATHSVGEFDAVSVHIEPRQGGHIVETVRDGGVHVWGTVTGWEPPHRLAFTWHPGSPEEQATAVEVGFTAAGAGTVVTLVHTGWENRPDGAGARQGYDTGWDVVLGHLVDFATKATAG